MRKVTDFIVEKRNIVLVIFIILSAFCLFLSTKVNINSDITKYLPDDSETKIGKEIMDSEFEEQKQSVLNVVYKGLSDDEKTELYNNLLDIDGVSSVDYDDTTKYNKDEYTLYVINVDDYASSDTSTNVYKEVQKEYKPYATSGSIDDENKTILHLWIVILAISMAMVILIIMCESYVEPFLYLISIGMAVFINKGTNIMFPSVSNITDSITAILQLALSMDYSIMLSNRYRQERASEKDKVKAMKTALYHSFSSIMSSSVTTVVGLLALVFMSFTIGKDLGFVLAKGVFLSLIGVLLCLPALILLFDKLIYKTHKKSPKFNLKLLGNMNSKIKFIQPVAIVTVFVASFLLKGNLQILYTDSEQDEVAKIFGADNQIAIVYENKYEDLVSDYCRSINDQNINQVLCYGNTINEKLKYNELNQKLSDLGQDTSIDDYLLKVIYYNYFNKENIKLSSFDFINFIKNDIYNNEKFNSLITDDIKTNIELLSNFTDKDNVLNSKNIKDISNILGINESDASDILLLYNSKNVNTKMTISEFANFINNYVLNDSKYSSSINSDTIESIKKLSLFSNKEFINQKLNYEQMSNVFGIDKELTKKLFLFYRLKSDTNTKLTLNEFANFVYTLKSDPTYSNLISDDISNTISILKLLSNKEFINTKFDSNTMSNNLSSFGLNKETIDKIYLYYAINNDSNSEILINEFVKLALSLSNDSNYSSYFDADTINNLNKLDMLTTYYDKELDSNTLYLMFGSDSLDLNTISNLVSLYGTNNLMKPIDFVNLLLNSGLVSDEASLQKLNYSLNIMNNAQSKLNYSDLANTLGVNQNLAKTIYGINDYNNGKVSLSIKELVNFILNHKDDSLLSSAITTYLPSLYLANNIMENVENSYTYGELSDYLNSLMNKEVVSKELLKQVYSLYDYNSVETLITPYEFVNLIINNQNDSLLSGNITVNTLSTLNLLNTIMNSTINNIYYSSSELSNLINMDNNTVSLLYSLYNSLYIKENMNISLINYTDFIISDVITNDAYKNKFDEKSIEKLNTVNDIMHKTINDYKYDSKELYNTLNKLTDKLNYDLVDILYIYYGSINNYDETYELTVESFVNYLYKDILNDSRFKDFIDSEMKEKINSANENIGSAKNLLVTDKYSRAILNTSYELEGADTLEFVQNTLDKFEGKEGIYVIGDSPMALEMSKTFSSELDFITILTIIFIFVVVAFTFKSILVSIILVLIIQTAVYLTMGILSLMGGSVYFISLLIVQAILMGATIDYAIVYTSYYKESRLTMNIKDSLINAYNKSIHTILTSSSILIIVTLIVANFASAIAAKICETLSQGTLCSVLLILLILPGILAAFDKVICKNGKK